MPLGSFGEAKEMNISSLDEQRKKENKKRNF